MTEIFQSLSARLLPAADPERVRTEVEDVIGLMLVKLSQPLPKLHDLPDFGQTVEKVPAPTADAEALLLP